MAVRKLMAFSASDAFQEEIAATDTTSFGGLTISPGNIAMSGTGKVTGLAAGAGAGDAISYGQSGASLAGLALTAALAMGGFKITGMGDPTVSTDGATKNYVDGLVNGVTWKPPVVAVSTSNIAALTGLTTTVDTVALNTDGQRVVLTAQSTPSQNGIWVVHSGAWTRPADFAVGAHAADAAVFVEEGGSADTAWVCTTDPPNDIIDTDGLAFVQFSSAGIVTAGNGLSKTGNVISVKQGDGIDLVANSNATNVALDASAPGIQFTGASPNGKLQVKADANGGLSVVANGVQVKVDATTGGNPTLAIGANGLRVIGVPSLFNINSVAVSANVTSANLGTLTAGSGSDASALHTHVGIVASNASRVQNSYVTVGALAAGDPTYISGTANQVDQALANTDAKARVIGLNSSASVLAAGTAVVISHGPNAGVLSGATAGTPYYLQSAGGIGTSVPGSGNRIIEVGVAINTTDLWVRILDFGKKP